MESPQNGPINNLLVPAKKRSSVPLFVHKIHQTIPSIIRFSNSSMEAYWESFLQTDDCRYFSSSSSSSFLIFNLLIWNQTLRHTVGGYWKIRFPATTRARRTDLSRRQPPKTSSPRGIGGKSSTIGSSHLEQLSLILLR